MPILAAEPDQYPDDLWNPPSAPTDLPAEEPARWWCLHTKPRQEKKTARYLRSQELAYYLPQIVQESRTPKGRTIRPVHPLFPGYVFFRGTLAQRGQALEGKTVANVLEVTDQHQILHDLSQVRKMLVSGLVVHAEPKYPVGTLVRVISGPLEGLSGLIYRRGSHHRFMAMVKLLGQGASVSLEDWQVEPIQDERPEGIDLQHLRRKGSA